MVHFSKLKLYGFKSFVDKTELEIGPGLNGIVGPNGCGKSNLVEALRWVMGEKSAKNMRGGGMEDVIFAGTSKRPARNMAQATVIIDNQDGTAPAPFNTSSEIEITRHIERDKGSQYRVNGKAVRARDVNLLFADTMTGANSPALVSQGRITEIIVAKPQDRRRILEESAGISGLHSRRHEAELRLRAAEQNLVRLNDAMNETRSRLTSLKRQARQAERYKELNSEIRKSDIALSWIEWRDLHQKIKAERESFKVENEAVQASLSAIKELESKIKALDDSLPQMRTDDMEARAVLQNFKISLDRLDEGEKAKARDLQNAVSRQAQLNQDLEFAREKYDQAVTLIEETETEIKIIEGALQDIPATIETVEGRHQLSKDTVNRLMDEKTALEQQIAVAEDNRETLQSRYTEAQNRLKQTQDKVDAYKSKIETFEDEIADINTSLKDLPNIEVLEAQLQSLTANRADTQELFEEMQANCKTAKDLLDDQTRELNITEAEYNALNDLLSRQQSPDGLNDIDDSDRLLNHLNVKAGYEKAVSNAIGHWLSMAGIIDAAPVYWHEINTQLNCPSGFKPLSNFVDAPQSLHTLLRTIGVCDALPVPLPPLQPGQSLVSLNGDIYRWDGMVAKAGAADEKTETASLIFEQKNRLAELEKTKAEQSDAIETTQSKLDNITDKRDADEQALADLNTQIANAKTDLTNTMHQTERLADRKTALENQKSTTNAELTSALDECESLHLNIKSLGSDLAQADTAKITEKRVALDKVREEINIAQAGVESIQAELSALRYKRDDYNRQVQSLTARAQTAAADRDSYNQRLEAITNRLDEVDEQIKSQTAAADNTDLESKRETLLSKISEQQSVVDELAIALEHKEADYKSIQTKLRENESGAAGAREKRAMAQANVANAEQDMARIEARIKEKFELNPQSLEEQTLSLFDSGLPNQETLTHMREQNLQKRDSIGPVNLRATVEMDETESQLATMEVEYNDLTKAIAQLRGGISKLNREARERLAIAFKRVDTHFQSLFSELFTGGKAYLEMIESDDPLESGLEIYAQPPGKALQKLSLLSGGEQTLTATALIFAMFMTNPSPICVLDEIDAPLDDANVDRVCSLMESIVRTTETRFIVITHHRMTMARMDRLYGVTMAERGVSQLVSVDMAMQDELSLEETA